MDRFKLFMYTGVYTEMTRIDKKEIIKEIKRKCTGAGALDHAVVEKKVSKSLSNRLDVYR